MPNRISLAFNLLKDKLCLASFLALLDYMRAFKVECDASGIGYKSYINAG